MSNDRQATYRAAHPLEDGKCIVCLGMFTTKHANSRKCDPCRGRHRRKCRYCAETFIGSPGSRHCGQCVITRTCRSCAKAFVADTKHPKAKFCSKACSDAFWTARKRISRHGARVDGAEPVTKAVLAKRDGKVCCLCAKPLNMKLKWPDPDCATIDHIIPTTRGGKHVLANCQLAHLRCNSSKANRSPYRAFLFSTEN